MGSLFTTLLNSTGSLQVYGRAFSVIQNNIANANTPGYARQEQTIIALPFDPANGRAGGLLAGPMLSARSQYIEQNVRGQQEQHGAASQKALDLQQVEQFFSLTSEYGIPKQLNQFFDGFSQLAVNPNDQVARQSVLDSADELAQSFNRTATGINQVKTNVDRQTVDATGAINRLGQQIATINSQYRASSLASQDAGLEAQLYSSLEELSQYVNFAMVKSPDGSADVYLEGGIPMVVGKNFYGITEDLSGATTVIRDSQGKDITASLQRGKLGALIEEKNTTIPGYLTELGALASGLADTVNTTLAAGVDKNGATPILNLFAYNNATDAAFTLRITPITPDEIAAATSAAPGGNGNALTLAGLANTPSMSGGFTFTEFYGKLSAHVGRDVGSARQASLQFSDSVAQAQAQRKELTGVNLDQEAAKIIQFQQAYQAMGKLVSILDEMTSSLLNMIH